MANRAKQTYETLGEIFEDGVIELVKPGNASEPQLLWWNGKRKVIAPQVLHAGNLYRAREIDPSLGRNLRLPTGALAATQPKRLVAQTRRLLEEYLGYTPTESLLLTGFVATTWFTDILPSPPPLYLYGMDMNMAMRVFRLLSCLSRRGVIVPSLRQADIMWLTEFAPTLFINEPEIPARFQDLCHRANYRGVVIPGTKKTVKSIVGSKAFFLGTNGAAPSCRDQGIQLALPIPRRDLPQLDEGVEAGIADDFQPRFLSHRLRYLTGMPESVYLELTGRPSNLAGTLQLCAEPGGKPTEDWSQAVEPQIRHAEATRNYDPEVVIIELLFSWFHSGDGHDLCVSDLTADTNDVLRDREELRVYSPEEIGRRLDGLRLKRHRKSSGMVVDLDRDNSREIHWWANHFGILKAVSGCQDCTDASAMRK